jgi:hypothetical protein
MDPARIFRAKIMRHIGSAIAGLVLVLGIAACAPMSRQGGAGDTSSAPFQSNQEPQSPNSLPAGARVNAPLTPSTGVWIRIGS